MSERLLPRCSGQNNVGTTDSRTPEKAPCSWQSSDVLGLRPNDLRCHHEAWLHLDFVEWHDVQHQREKQCQRILLKERSSPYHYGKKSGRISDIMSDHSLPS